MASSSSDTRGRDLLIYLFYHGDIANKSSDEVFPRIVEGQKFVDMEGFRFVTVGGTERTNRQIQQLALNESSHAGLSTYKKWSESKSPSYIIRSDSDPNVDVLYITNTLIINYSNPKSKAEDLINRLANERYRNHYLYMVRFCDRIDNFSSAQNIKDLKLLISPQDSVIDDLNFFLRDRGRLIDYFFVANYFQKAGVSTSSSRDNFELFLEKLNIRNVLPCFVYRPMSEQVDTHALPVNIINKYTYFFFLPFDMYTSDIYTDYAHLTEANIDIPHSIMPKLNVNDLLVYERMIIDELRIQVAELTAKNDALEESLLNLSVDEEFVKEQQARSMQLRAQLLNLQGRVEESIPEASSSSSFMGSSSESSVVMRRNKIQELKQEIRELKEEIRRLKAEIARLRGENDSMRTIIRENEDLPEKLDSLTKAHEDMQVEVEDLINSNREKDMTIVELRAQLEALRLQQLSSPQLSSSVIINEGEMLFSSSSLSLDISDEEVDFPKRKQSSTPIADISSIVRSTESESESDFDISDPLLITPPRTPSPPPMTGTSSSSAGIVDPEMMARILDNQKAVISHLQSSAKYYQKEANAFQKKMQKQLSKNVTFTKMISSS